MLWGFIIIDSFDYIIYNINLEYGGCLNSFNIYEDEIKSLLEEISKNPRSKSFVKLANIYLKLNMLDESIAILKEGLRYNPDNISALIILGKALKEKKYLSQAAKNFEKVLTLDPQNIIATGELANIRKREGNLQESLKLYDTLIFLDPLNENAKRELNYIKNKLDEEKRIREEEERRKKMKEEEKIKKETEKTPQEEKKIVDDFIIQHLSTVISFDEQVQEKTDKKVMDEKEIKEEEIIEESKEDKNEEAMQEKTEKIIDEQQYIKKDVDPFIKKEENENKENKDFIPYELDGKKRYQYFSEEIANIYVEQKKFEKAIQIYQVLLRQDPENEKYAQKLRYLNDLIIKVEVDETIFEEKKETNTKDRSEFVERLNRSLTADEITPQEKKEIEEKFEKIEENRQEEEKEHKEEFEKENVKNVIPETKRNIENIEKKNEEKIEQKKEERIEKEESKDDKIKYDFQKWLKMINKTKK